MAEGDHLPPQNTFGIQCGMRQVNQTTGKAEPGAFRRKENHPYVSGGWLENCASSSQPEQIKEFCRQLVDFKRTVTENNKIAVLGVQEVITTIGEGFGLNVKFVHHPEDFYECHSGMYGADYLGTLVEEELAELADTVSVVLD